VRGVQQDASRRCFKNSETGALAALLLETIQGPRVTTFGGLSAGGVEANKIEAVRNKVMSHEQLRQLVLEDRSKLPDDTLALSIRKLVSISPEGNRGARVVTEAMALREGVSSRVIGSIVWKNDMRAPKWRMRSARRSDPLSRAPEGRVRWNMLKNQRSAISFELVFEPPLRVGEVVRYGFYVWNSRHYAMTRSEAEELYGDRWVREGVAVRGPTDWIEIAVRLPHGFRVQESRLEKNPILNADGPNVPGSVVEKVAQSGRLLSTARDDLEVGRYFLSWIPPEKTPRRRRWKYRSAPFSARE